MGRAAPYDADQVAIWIGGVLAEGFADGEYITVEQMSDGFSSVVGTSGEVARSKTNDRRVKVTLKLLQTSKTNAQLSAIHQRDLNAPNGAGVFEFLMEDLSSEGTIVQGHKAWIVKWPDAPNDRTAKSREWVIEIADGNRLEMGAADLGE